jgi:hypothetical protein
MPYFKHYRGMLLFQLLYAYFRNKVAKLKLVQIVVKYLNNIGKVPSEQITFPECLLPLGQDAASY